MSPSPAFHRPDTIEEALGFVVVRGKIVVPDRPVRHLRPLDRPVVGELGEVLLPEPRGLGVVVQRRPTHGRTELTVAAALTMGAVGRTAFCMIEEVRRQFRETPGLLEGREGVRPDYARCVPCAEGAGIEITQAPPVLAYDSFNIQAAATMDYSIQKSWSIDDTFSWFVPDAKGRHDMKFGVRYTNTWLSNPNWSNMNGTFAFRNYQDRPFDPTDPRSFPERLTIRVPGTNVYQLVMHVYEIFAQDKWQPTSGLTIGMSFTTITRRTC